VSLLSSASGSGPVTVWTESFEGDPTSRGVVTVQDAAPPTSASDGQLTAWNLIHTQAPTTLLTWDGAYDGPQYYYVGLDKTTKVVSGLAYTDNADTSLILLNKAIPSGLGETTATLSFALAGASEDGYDFLHVDIKDHNAPDTDYVTLLSFTGQTHTTWTDSNGAPLASAIQSVDVSSYLGHNVDIRFHFTSDFLNTDAPAQDPGWCVDDVSLTEGGAVTTPSAPLDLTVTNASASYVNLSWSAPATDGGANVTIYHVYRGTSPGSETFLANSTVTAYSDTSVTSGTTYYYTVAAENSVGIGPQSNEVSANASSPTIPGAPLNLTASASGSSIVLNWHAPTSNGGAAITAYNIYRATASGSEAFYTAVGNVHTYTDSGVTAGTTYYYEVSANNSVGEGSLSNEANATPTNASSALAFTNYAGPASTDSSGEPTIGVNWNTGNVMMMTGGFPLLNIPPSQHVSRIVFNDSTSPATATWSDATPTTMITNVDPILNTDPTTGRTFAGGDDGACTILSRTDDDGQTWLPVGNSCTGTVDHPTVGQGPPSPGAPIQPVGALYPHVVYVCQQESLAECATSNDGGNTFLPSVPVTCGFANPGIFGHLRVGPDGAAYIPFNNCDTNEQGFSYSTSDGQLGWTGVPLSIVPASQGGDPSIAVGRGDKTGGHGRLYFATHDGATDHAVVTTSADHVNWSAPVDLSVSSANSTGDAFGVKSIVFPTVIAGDDDRAAVAFLGTKDAGNAYVDGFTGHWDLYIAVTYDGGNTWTSVDATPNDPVQRGPICLSGIGCSSSRNLLDFMDIVVDQQGHILVGYADGCIQLCALPTGTVAQSTHALATIARQSGGDCLFAGRCGPASGTPTTGTSLLPKVDKCDPNTVIFSSNSAVGAAVNAHAFACDAEALNGGSGPVDTAFINPGSDQVKVRYTIDLGANATAYAILNGLGLTNYNATLNRTAITGGGFTFDSANVAIDPSASGSITADVWSGGIKLDSVTFHTLT
jgi:hypothetical protein